MICNLKPELLKLIDQVRSEYNQFQDDYNSQNKFCHYSNFKLSFDLPAEIKLIGAGSTRICFEYDNKCYKFNLNEHACLQMQTEIQTLNKGIYSCFPKIFDYDKDEYSWEIVELCRKPTLIDISLYTDNIYNTLSDVRHILTRIRQYNYNFYRVLKFSNSKKDNKFINYLKTEGLQQKVYNDFLEYWKNENNASDDFFYDNDNLGIAKRNNEEILIAVDAGSPE